jgi:hypothetical protein
MTRGPQDIETAVSLKDIFWDQKVQQSGPATGGPQYLVEGNPSGQAAGFNPEHGYPTYVTKASLPPETPSCGGACGERTVLTETFTFAGDLAAGLTASDFVVHVQYRGGGSGFIGGLPGTTAATPAPEPVTMFLGGTGLLALAYAGRKRLFSRFAK